MLLGADSGLSLRARANLGATLKADVHIRLKPRFSLHCRMAAQSPKKSEFTFYQVTLNEHEHFSQCGRKIIVGFDEFEPKFLVHVDGIGL
jgi:hypothetical protein